MFKILIFICSANLAPQDCQENNALDVIVGPTVLSEQSCGRSGRAYLAATAFHPTGRKYIKILCERSASTDSNDR
jgi:hypothetical protein